MQKEFKMNSISIGIKNISAFPLLCVHFFENNSLDDQKIGYNCSLSAHCIKKLDYSLY